VQLKNINMKQLLPLFLFLLPCFAWAQYPSNGNQKITLGEQTTADGLIFRGVAETDTVRKPSIDTMAYMVLDTTTNIMWHYKKATSNAWLRLNLLPSDTASMLTNYWRSGRFSGTLPVANGGTGITSLGTGVATFLGTPSSANLALAVTNETGSGNLVFATQPVFTNTIGIGGATASTSGSGITFPATQSASTNVNTLDDYEEGTWTPIIDGFTTSPTITYTTQAATYTKVGRLVTFEFLVRGNRTSGGSGRIFIRGLPFTSAEVYGYSVVVSSSNIPTTLPLVGTVNNSNTGILFYTSTLAVTEISNWCSDCYIYCSGSYHIN